MAKKPDRTDWVPNVIHGPGDTGVVEYIKGEDQPLGDGGNTFIVLTPPEFKKRRGRAYTHDWIGAAKHVAVMVGKEGMPQGEGATTTIKQWIDDWFDHPDRRLDVQRGQAFAMAKAILDEYKKLSNKTDD